jgi:hypothetical protein
MIMALPGFYIYGTRVQLERLLMAGYLLVIHKGQSTVRRI